MTFKNCFSDCYSLVDLVDTNPPGFHSYMFWELVLQLQTLNIGVPDMVFNPFSPQVEAWDCEFSPDCALLHKGWDLR